ncbi:MAG: GNAT family N-acetyltransferase [Saprospiraceae bacterium]|nr:GNAT family N-acetyltransferase [Saprospiraceae bacterium]
MIQIQRIKSPQKEKAYQLMKVCYPERNHDIIHLKAILSQESNIIVTVSYEGKVIGGATAYIIDMITRLCKELFVYEVGIEESFQCKGYGKMLMEYLFKLAESERCDKVFVITEQSNIKANKLYKSAGCKGDHAVCYTHIIN